MPTNDLKRTLDETMTKLKTLHQGTVAELQKANEAAQAEYVKFLEAQLELIAQASKGVEAAMNTKAVPFV